jgi:LacI family transcriptional regulator
VCKIFPAVGNVLNRVTLEDVAREACVSVATVDRVINRRPGVRRQTVDRVEAVVQKLNYRPDPVAARLARNKAAQFGFVLPNGNNTFFDLVAEQVTLTADWMAAQRAYIETHRVDVFDPDVLTRSLETLGPRYDGLVTVALDHPKVRSAIDELALSGIAVVTLVSDAPRSRRLHYVGIDNAAAGRTAGTMMGRYLAGRSGRIAVIAGSMALRDHAERHFGFTQVLGGEYGQLRVLPVAEGRDDNTANDAIVRRLLAEHDDLLGIYNIGAGNRGVAAALEAAGRADSLVYIGHELTPYTRRFLLRGVMDVCISQDPGHEVRSSARVLLAHHLKEPLVAAQERIGIDIFVRDNVP